MSYQRLVDGRLPFSYSSGLAVFVPTFIQPYRGYSRGGGLAHGAKGGGLAHGAKGGGLAHGAKGGGLAEGEPPLVATTQADPWGVRLAEVFGTPLVTALSSRIAYGTTPPYPSQLRVTTPGGGYSAGAYGGFQPSTLLLLGGAALLAVVLLRSTGGRR